MTPSRWLAVIALLTTLICFSLARWRIEESKLSSYTRQNTDKSELSTPRAALTAKLIVLQPGDPVLQTEGPVARELRRETRRPAASLIQPKAGDDSDQSVTSPDTLVSPANELPSYAASRPIPAPSTADPLLPVTGEVEPVQVIESAESDVVNSNSPDPFPVLLVPAAPALSQKAIASNYATEVWDDARPWWDQKVTNPMRASSNPKAIGLEDMILGALRHSPRVRAISDTPLIRETAIMESQGEFDWRAFMESRFTDTSDPVGSTLTTGGPSRLNDQNWRYSSGLRRKMYTGGKFEISQRIGLEESNSQFFSPTDQANSKLALSFTQPLLNGAGRAYNTSLILLAQIDTDAAQDEFSKQLQDHLLEVTRTYWELYRNRAVLLQKRQVHAQAVYILEELESRRAVDSLESQIVRARAAVATRQAEIVRSEAAIRNTEAKLRVLVNDPELVPNDRVELLPAESPSSQLIEINLTDSLATAMQHRPEIDQATRNVRAASVRLGISKKELQPVLDFVAETYASGLDGDFALGKSYGNQFSEGRPSYSVGLVFEIPLCNREARARYQRRQLELEQLAHELQNVIETTKAEVEIAVREVETSFREMQGKLRAVSATAEEVRYLQERWKMLPGEDQVASFLLEDLLDAQDRLAAAEFDFVSSQIAYTLSVSELKRAMGTLLESEQVEVTRTCNDGKPTMLLDKRQKSNGHK